MAKKKTEKEKTEKEAPKANELKHIMDRLEVEATETAEHLLPRAELAKEILQMLKEVK